MQKHTTTKPLNQNKMKNIHVLPTDKPSRLFKDDFDKYFISLNIDQEQNHFKPQNIYITNSEEIKEGDWCYDIFLQTIFQANSFIGIKTKNTAKKIILTTDQDLIKDGVQSIDDKFLEWFVKNPSCEEVEVGYGWIRLTETDNEGYWVSIPDKQFEMQQEEPKQEYEYIGECKGNNGNGCFMDSPGHDCGCFTRILQEEPKQETLEEVLPKNSNGKYSRNEIEKAFELGAKLQKERMYSEEDLRESWHNGMKSDNGFFGSFEEWFEQFKKK